LGVQKLNVWDVREELNENLGVSDQKIEVSNEKNEVSNEKIGVSNKNLGISIEKIGVLMKIWPSLKPVSDSSPRK